MYLKPIKTTYAILSTALVVLMLGSCSLVRIESEQEPLTVKALNTRLMTQDFVGEAMEVTQKTADTILKDKPSPETQKLLLLWKINTAKQLKVHGFQAAPEVALLDVWTYMIRTKYFFAAPKPDYMSDTTYQTLQNTTTANANKISKIAQSVHSKKDFEKLALFVEEQARTNPITSYDFETISSVKEDYLKLTETPDSLSVRTVGTLSEVVSDLGSKLSYGSELTRKQLQWETLLYLKEKGLDTLDMQKKLQEFQDQTHRLITIAENSPQLLDSALINFRNQIDPIFIGLERGITSSMIALSNEFSEIDLLLERERLALDSILQRERKIITEEAHLLMDSGIKNTMEELRKTIRTLTVLAIFLIIVILGLPFYAGYLLGKKKNVA
ncbi:hypothetical protein J0656_17420 [Muricauda ruestringensis]|uniref:Chemotaxis protein n=1 Tax=Flagellimonas aurea TaxID=2915619 RepID=A0ABS3G9V1_9FLAO|nr:hypothetical protein [Allomuricauda aurea]MBO0355802.1 hypothetical protein [Allomuricauda aurea]